MTRVLSTETAIRALANPERDLHFKKGLGIEHVYVAKTLWQPTDRRTG